MFLIATKKMKYTISVLVVQRSDLYINVYGNFFKFKPYYINIQSYLITFLRKSTKHKSWITNKMNSNVQDHNPWHGPSLHTIL